MRLLGIDYGTKRTGIALSDEGARVAFPHIILNTRKNLLEEITTIVREHGVQKIVIGESKDFSMKDNLIMHDVKELQQDLENELKISVELHPEFMTSTQVTNTHFGAVRKDTREGDKERRVHNIDARAASIMLQSYIDSSK